MPRDAESIRRRIKAEQLTDRLQNHALGKTAMSPSQITAAIALIRKVSPDLKSIDITSSASNRPLITIVNYTDLTPDGLPAPDSRLETITLAALPEPEPDPESMLQ